jgi:hypothetical protein
MRSVAALFCCGLLFVTASCGFNDIRDRQAILEKLLATNAPLSAVECAIGPISIYRRGSPEWNAFRAACLREPHDWYQRLVQKLDKASAFGGKGTPWMQSWIFLDDEDRLIDFAVGTQ